LVKPREVYGVDWSSMQPRERNLKKKANQLETAIVELEHAVRKDKARLTNLLSRA